MITAVVPVRKGSVRVKNKNMRAFAGSNLLQIKLNTLKAVGLFDNIVVSTDSEAMMEVARKAGVDIHSRDPYYASSECNNSEFFENIAQSIESDIIAYTPVTSPLVSRETYREVINKYKAEGLRNIVTASYIKHHMWLNGEPLNYDIMNAPNSQDLPNIIALNYGINIITRHDMLQYKNIVTSTPTFYMLDEIESVDIDTELDFIVAETLYTKLYGITGE